jgi:hypothetical protein
MDLMVSSIRDPRLFNGVTVTTLLAFYRHTLPAKASQIFIALFAAQFEIEQAQHRVGVG